MFNFFKKKKIDPICGMEVKNGGISKHGEIFCSKQCLDQYEQKDSESSAQDSVS